MSSNTVYQIIVHGTDHSMDESFVKQVLEKALNANNQKKTVQVANISPFESTHDYRIKMRKTRDMWAEDLDNILESGKGTLWCGAACARLIARMRAFSFELMER